MGKWEDRVASHAVNTTFDKVLTALQGLDVERVEQAPEDVARLLWVTRHVRTRLEHTPAMAVPAATLDLLDAQLNQIAAEVTNFAGNGNVAHLANALVSADAILEQARVLRPLPPEGTAAEAESYLKQVQDLVAKVAAAADAEVTQTRQSAEAGRAEAARAYEALNQQLTTATSTAAAVQATIQEQTARLEEALTGQAAGFAESEKAHADAFAAAEKQRAAAAAEAKKSLSDQFDATAKKLGDDYSTAVEKLSQQASETSTQLRDDAAGNLLAISEMKTQADELLGAIGVAGVAAGYNETAKQEKKVADKWRLATVGVALVAAVVLVSALFVDHATAGSWQRLATRFVISLSFAGLAAYCGRQSGEHRQVERDARRRQLQLAALNPYLANLPSQVSALLKAQLAPGYFTPEDPRGDGEDAEAAAQVYAGQIKEVLTALATKGAAQ